MPDAIRWGIVGTGQIAATYVQAVRGATAAELVAVASRQPDTADAFAEVHRIATAHGSYEALAEDPNVDVVYIATPHHRHLEDCLLYLEAGKHVVCEKPLALNGAQATEIAEAARRSGRFFVEAIWSRFVPSYRTLAELLAAGTIGQVLHVDATFGARLPFDPTQRLFDLERAGGSLLDMGIYPVQLAHLVLGSPTEVTAVARIGDSGVDEHTVVVMSFAEGAMAVGQSAIRTELPCTARIAGTDGVIELPRFMLCSRYVEVETSDGRSRVETPPLPSPWTAVVDEVDRCMRAGETETPIMPLADSCAIATTLDRARDAIGLRYPME